jgi:hypothetical protein
MTNARDPACRRSKDRFRVKQSPERGAYEMFIQIIQGTCHDSGALRRQIDRWRRELGGEG